MTNIKNLNDIVLECPTCGFEDLHSSYREYAHNNNTHYRDYVICLHCKTKRKLRGL